MITAAARRVALAVASTVALVRVPPRHMGPAAVERRLRVAQSLVVHHQRQTATTTLVPWAWARTAWVGVGAVARVGAATTGAVPDSTAVAAALVISVAQGYLMLPPLPVTQACQIRQVERWSVGRVRVMRALHCPRLLHLMRQNRPAPSR